MSKFPKSIKKAPNVGKIVFFAEPLEEGFYSSSEWENESLFFMYLNRGFVHLSKENAIAHAKALIKFSKKKWPKNLNLATE